jgi:hypothetical protein
MEYESKRLLIDATQLAFEGQDLEHKASENHALLQLGEEYLIFDEITPKRN